MSSDGGKQKKNVRFPDDTRLSQSRDATPQSDEEEDYFNYEHGSAHHHDDEEEDSDTDIRQQTRTNTIQNRMSVAMPVPGFSVTPPPLASPMAFAGSGLDSLGDLGNMGGMAPGARQVPDNDPLNEEYTQRRHQLLSSLTPEQLRMVNRPSVSGPESPNSESPFRDRAGNMEGAIPLKRLVSGVEERLQNLRHERQPSEGQMHEIPKIDIENSSQGTLKDDDPKEKGRSSKENSKENLSSVQSPDASRREAEEIARQLVRAHNLGGGPAMKNTGFVQNTFYLEKAGDLDDDRAAAAEPDSNPDGAQPNLEMEVGGKMDDDLSPERVREGVLGSLLRLYAEREQEASSQFSLSTGATPLTTPGGSPVLSATGTPTLTPPLLSRSNSSLEQHPTTSSLAPAGSGSAGSSAGSGSGKKKSGGLKPPQFLRSHSNEDVLGRSTKGRRQWHEKKSSKSSASAAFASLAANSLGAPSPELLPEIEKKEKKKKNPAANLLKPHEHYSKQQAKRKRRAKLDAEQARITIHIADLLQRQRFILRFGRALMLFGAPSHRLEEYMRVTARTLEIDAQFLYMPGCMLVSFGDATTHTSETKLLKVPQGLNLTKLDATHLIFKEVVHGLMEIEEAGTHIDNLLQGKNPYPAWASILFFGLATGFLCLFAFGGWWADLPVAVAMGSMVGFLQIWVAPRSDLYSNVFEVSASVLISFIGRAFGSIRPSKPIFCFGAIVQGSLALILPGYIILCGSLELQSKNLVAGAVRMFYAIIYSTFLSFGITLGSAIFGWIDGSAVARTDCWAHEKIDDKFKILFVPLSALFLSLVNQASPRQLPTMVLIASCGYVVLYFVQTKIANASSFTSALGALTIGLLGNLYSRVGHGLAFAAMLPAIFVIVPSGLAAQGSLIAGLTMAESITNGSNHNSSEETTTTTTTTTNNSVTDLGGTMTEVAVGITVGLFVATLMVYPLGTGKKRSGLFTF